MPTAGGDTLYGVMRGFAELAALCGARMPTVFAVQPEGANPLSRSLAAGAQVEVVAPRSIALSLADPRVGRHAMVAVARWGGEALDVTEVAIAAAMTDLARIGIYADPRAPRRWPGFGSPLSKGLVVRGGDGSGAPDLVGLQVARRDGRGLPRGSRSRRSPSFTDASRRWIRDALASDGPEIRDRSIGACPSLRRVNGRGEE